MRTNAIEKPTQRNAANTKEIKTPLATQAATATQAASATGREFLEQIQRLG